MLTQEKVEALSAFLMKDEARAKNLLAMSAEDAAKEISAEGIELTAEDLAAFSAAAKNAQAEKNGELDEASLEGVSGGYRIPSTIYFPPPLYLVYPDLFKAVGIVWQSIQNKK